MIGWFLAPYERTVGTHLPGRRCAMAQFTPQIQADGGRWAHEECLGGAAVCKVDATAATLQAINAAAGFDRIPVARLNDPLSTLTAGQKTTIRNRILGLGYTAGELQAALGADLGAVTLGELLRFVLGRRLQARYAEATDEIILDGPQETPLPPETIDAQV